MEALKRGWRRFRGLPVVAQAVSWVVIGFLIVGLFSGSQDLDTDTGGTRRSPTTEGPATTEAETTTTSSTATPPPRSSTSRDTMSIPASPRAVATAPRMPGRSGTTSRRR